VSRELPSIGKLGDELRSEVLRCKGKSISLTDLIAAIHKLNRLANDAALARLDYFFTINLFGFPERITFDRG
jgi:hypothetical protein